MNKTIHVVPTDDLFPHNDTGDGGECQCKPKIEWINGVQLVIHNSYDGREWYERKFLEVEM